MDRKTEIVAAALNQVSLQSLQVIDSFTRDTATREAVSALVEQLNDTTDLLASYVADLDTT